MKFNFRFECFEDYVTKLFVFNLPLLILFVALVVTCLY
jgi:hypothetical protein